MYVCKLMREYGMPLAVLNAGNKRFASSRHLSMYICEEEIERCNLNTVWGNAQKVQKFQVRILDLSKRGSLFGRIYFSNCRFSHRANENIRISLSEAPLDSGEYRYPIFSATTSPWGPADRHQRRREVYECMQASSNSI